MCVCVCVQHINVCVWRQCVSVCVHVHVQYYVCKSVCISDQSRYMCAYRTIFVIKFACVCVCACVRACVCVKPVCVRLVTADLSP